MIPRKHFKFPSTLTNISLVKVKQVIRMFQTTLKATQVWITIILKSEHGLSSMLPLKQNFYNDSFYLGKKIKNEKRHTFVWHSFSEWVKLQTHDISSSIKLDTFIRSAHRADKTKSFQERPPFLVKKINRTYHKCKSVYVFLHITLFCYLQKILVIIRAFSWVTK